MSVELKASQNGCMAGCYSTYQKVVMFYYIAYRVGGKSKLLEWSWPQKCLIFSGDFDFIIQNL